MKEFLKKLIVRGSTNNPEAIFKEETGVGSIGISVWKTIFRRLQFRYVYGNIAACTATNNAFQVGWMPYSTTKTGTDETRAAWPARKENFSLASSSAAVPIESIEGLKEEKEWKILIKRR